MKAGKKHLVLAAAAGLLLLGVGCGDSTTEPQGFSVTLAVRDTLGHPVAGLELTMVPEGPWYMDPKMRDVEQVPGQNSLSGPTPNPFNPATTLRIEASQPCWVTLVIEDVDHGAVRTLAAQEIDAGAHAVMWNSLDEEGQKVPSGVYYAHLVLSDQEGGTVLFDGWQTMLLAHWGQGDTPVAVTNASGRIQLTDRRLFPYLYDLEPFASFDEVGNQSGLIVLTPAMRFYLTDPIELHTMRFDGEVAGRTSFSFTWEY